MLLSLTLQMIRYATFFHPVFHLFYLFINLFLAYSLPAFCEKALLHNASDCCLWTGGVALITLIAQSEICHDDLQCPGRINDTRRCLPAAKLPLLAVLWCGPEEMTRCSPATRSLPLAAPTKSPTKSAVEEFLQYFSTDLLQLD